MRTISRIIAAFLFIVFFGFALKNTQEVALRFFFEYELRGPLVLLLLGFFITGAALGVLGMTPVMFRHRRDVNQYKKAIEKLQKESELQKTAPLQPPQPDSITTH